MQKKKKKMRLKNFCASIEAHLSTH